MAVNERVVSGHAVHRDATNPDTLWTVPVSQESENCHNPIRSIEEGQFEDVLSQRRKDVELIKLSIGACYFIDHDSAPVDHAQL